MERKEILYLVLFCQVFSTNGFSYDQPNRKIDPALQKEIDDFINQVYLPYSKTSKLGLTVVQNNGEILYSTGYGMADEERNIPNSNQTQFLIASVTKSFTSLLVVKVLHELFPLMGEAVLDTPIRKLIPDSNFILQDRFRSEHGTFRDLIAHRMYFYRDDLPLISEGLHNSTEIVYRQRYNKEICGMRSEFQYSNQMYLMAGELISILANKPFEQLMSDLLKDIGMLNSSLASASDDYSNMPYRTKPYYVMDNVSYPMNVDLLKRIVPQNPAGGLFVPPNDMVKYIMFHLNKGNVNGRQIIPEEAMSWTIKPSIHVPQQFFKENEEETVGSTFGYGLGLIVAHFDGWQYIHHNGYLSPYASLLSMFPAKNLGVFTSANEGPVWVDSSVVHAFIFQLLNGKTATEARENAMQLLQQNKLSKEKKLENRQKQVKKLLEENNRKAKSANDEIEIIGKYGSGTAGEAEILEKFNEQTNSTQLYVQYGKWYHGWIENVGGSLYQITWDTDIVQELYSIADTSGLGYMLVENDTLEFIAISGETRISQGKFQLGVSLDKLPPIPWSPESCGPE